MNRLRVAAYARVSTDMEDQLHSLSAQITYFTEYISEHENWELIEVYYDEGITGTSTKKRDGFNRMIEDCEKGKIDTILTKEVSRFARNTVDTLNYTRRLAQLKINVIFMSDGINTDDKDGELRLTIMSSLAQEESRKISERVKWGMRRNMENGVVLGCGKLLGYRIKDGKLEVVPEEAEIVQRIFREYVYEGKGAYSIAKGLNSDGFRSVKGGLFRQDSVARILKNEKYCGDLTQWKKYSENYLTKKMITNKNDNPNAPLITVENNHDGIISREVFIEAQKLMNERGEKVKNGMKYSGLYWFSGKVKCGKCGTNFSKVGKRTLKNPIVRCLNRAMYGKNEKTDAHGKKVGCDNCCVTENILIVCIKYVLEYIRTEREEITQQLMEEIQLLQNQSVVCDTKELQSKIDKIVQKKQNAIDLMLEGIITKDDLKNQVTLYENEIDELSAKISYSNNISYIHTKQLEGISEYIAKINGTADINTDSKEVYKAMLDKMVSYENGVMDVYLNCVPFGFKLSYHKEKTPHSNRHTIVVDDCAVI